MELLAWLVRVPESQQQAQLDSIAALGKVYVDALSAAALNPGLTEASRRHKVAILESHSVFRQALAEALGRPPS